MKALFPLVLRFLVATAMLLVAAGLWSAQRRH